MFEAHDLSYSITSTRLANASSQGEANRRSQLQTHTLNYVLVLPQDLRSYFAGRVRRILVQLLAPNLNVYEVALLTFSHDVIGRCIFERTVHGAVEPDAICSKMTVFFPRSLCNDP